MLATVLPDRYIDGRRPGGTVCTPELSTGQMTWPHASSPAVTVTAVRV